MNLRDLLPELSQRPIDLHGENDQEHTTNGHSTAGCHHDHCLTLGALERNRYPKEYEEADQKHASHRNDGLQPPSKSGHMERCPGCRDVRQVRASETRANIGPIMCCSQERGKSFHPEHSVYGKILRTRQSILP